MIQVPVVNQSNDLSTSGQFALIKVPVANQNNDLITSGQFALLAPSPTTPAPHSSEKISLNSLKIETYHWVVWNKEPGLPESKRVCPLLCHFSVIWRRRLDEQLFCDSLWFSLLIRDVCWYSSLKLATATSFQILTGHS